MELFGFRLLCLAPGLEDSPGVDLPSPIDRAIAHLKQREAEGSWSSEIFYEPHATISTSFALLFLKRGTQGYIETEHAK